MTDKKKADKQIKVYADIHEQIKLLAVKENREMREIVATAFEFYLANRNRKDL